MTKIDQSKLIKLEEIKKLDINPYPYTFPQTHHAHNLLNKYSTLTAEEKTQDNVSIAGRIMLKRGMGKATFMHIQDQSGKIQIYLREDDLGQEIYDIIAKKTDLGDIIGITGTIFKTKMGEITIHTKSAQLLSKSLLPMPEKYHGLKDIELKYRQRYIDLTVNPEVKEVFQKRSKIIHEIRQYFHEKGFMEVETPTLQTIYGGASAKPFITHINTWDMQMYLSISPETYLKRLLVGGFEKVFSICKNFRNEDVDTSHNPEFTMLEIYQAYVDYNMMMEYLEQVYEKACLAINTTTKVEHIYKGEKVMLDFKAPWRRLSMIDAIKQYANINVSQMTENHLRNFLEDNRIIWEGKLTWGLGVQRIFEEMVEEHLIQPVHIIDHPKESTPLCKHHRNDSRLIERFESFCLGMELSNAYSELNDPLLQRQLLEEQSNQLRAGFENAHPMDEDFVNSIEFGMPPAGGLGFGIDRMAIILTSQNSIRDVILFPTMKPIEEDKPEQKYQPNL
ncbi:lysine--tRNA ligase [Candidatus Woesearchaeota archaeon]|nr:lysine--tRNA ligase [Candidatus Woesearchaeota archaeon]